MARKLQLDGVTLATKQLGDGPPTPQSPMDMLYTQFSSVFGNSNPRQLFSLVWPGTILNAEDFHIPDGTSEPFPQTVQISQSLLFDQFYPIAPTTQPDGTRVSDRYKQAIEAFGPMPNERLLDLQRIIRDRLDQRVEVESGGQILKCTLLEKFSLLKNVWIEKKQEWAKVKSAEYTRLKTTGDADWWDEYINWYKNNADAYIAAINAAYDRMLADFPLNEFEDALAILDTHDAAALLRAKQDVRNAEVPVPPDVGNTFYPSLAIPTNWGNSLRSTSTFIDLLASPEAQLRSIDLCIERLRGQVSAWEAVLAQIPSTSKEEMQAALNELSTASSSYFDKANQLIKDYTANTVLAVKTYIQYKEGSDDEKQAGAEDLLKKMGGGSDKPVDFKKVAEQVGEAQSKLIDDTGSMVSAGTRLSEKATAFLQSQAGQGLREMIQPVLSKIQAQLEILVRQISNFDASAGRTIELVTPKKKLEGDASDQSPLFSAPVDALFNDRWQSLTIEFDSNDLKTDSQATTSFSETSWNVDLFFGSAGGASSTRGEEFATNYVEANSKIEIGMLATKVLIERPWMHPEIFGMTKKFFRSLDTAITTPQGLALSSSELLSKSLGGNVDMLEAKKNCQALADGILPGYPVAILVVKDVTIKMKSGLEQRKALQAHSESNMNAGGGFLCFSVSHAQADSSDKKSIDSYSMAGDYVMRVPAPQIVGVWNQIMPKDESKFLDTDALERMLQFKVPTLLLKSVQNLKPHTDELPSSSRNRSQLLPGN